MHDSGVEPYIEAVPPRRQNWSLGYSVILMNFAGNLPRATLKIGSLRSRN